MTNQPDFLESKIIDVEWGNRGSGRQTLQFVWLQDRRPQFHRSFRGNPERVVIGRNCRVQSHSFICTKVAIDDNCFVGHGVTLPMTGSQKGNHLLILMNGFRRT